MKSQTREECESTKSSLPFHPGWPMLASRVAIWFCLLFTMENSIAKAAMANCLPLLLLLVKQIPSRHRSMLVVINHKLNRYGVR